MENREKFLSGMSKIKRELRSAQNRELIAYAGYEPDPPDPEDPPELAERGHGFHKYETRVGSSLEVTVNSLVYHAVTELLLGEPCGLLEIATTEKPFGVMFGAEKVDLLKIQKAE